mgnify:CR=1 FL=1|tara:strand:- start:33 stop:356 length:324 start_codon:yes stop_codon:yes gene_type:complete
MKTIKTRKEAFDIEIKLDEKEKLVYINASTTLRGDKPYKLNTGTVRTILKEQGVDFGRPIKKTTVHNMSDDPDTLNGTWIFELNVSAPRPTKKTLSRKKTPTTKEQE